MSKNRYDEKSIKGLKGLAAVRKRPGMYVGGTDKGSVYRLFREVLDNSVDEYQAGHNDKVFIWVWDDEIWVGDNGRGIPVKKHPKEKISTLTLALTVLHVGGKFDDKAYQVSCFTGGTKLRLLDGKKRSLKWLSKNYKDKTFLVYSCDKKGALHPGLAHSPRVTGEVDELIEVTLDTGKKERCTLDHLWRLLDGSYCKAKDLVVGTSLMPLYLYKGDDDYTYISPEGRRYHNHTVVAIRKIKYKKPIKVYDITVEKYHNFGLASGVFVHNSGLHGVGIKATNALSEWMKVYSKRDGSWYHQEFAKGKPKQPKPIKKRPPKDLPDWKKLSGTIIGFSADTTIMETKKTDITRLKEEVSDLSYLCPKLEFRLYVEGKLDTTYRSSKGLPEFVDDTFESAYQKKPFYAVSENKEVELSLLWTDQEDPEVFSYVNCSYTSAGGTHLTGLEKASSAVLKRYGSDLEAKDFRAGMCGILHVRMADPHYRGQTKEELSNSETEKKVYAFVKSELDVFFKKHPGVAKTIIKRAKILRKARNQSNLAKQALKMDKLPKKGKIGILPGKLVHADPRCPSSKRELFIVEGDSALGSCRDGREASFQEILPLRGKIQNAIRQAPTKFLANKEVDAIRQAVRVGIGQNQKIQNCRYNRIMILTDADPDGKHIASLIITMFSKYMPEVIKAGKLFVVKAPLFVGFYKNKRKFGFTIDKVRKKFPSGAKVQYSRLKGLGESSADEVSEYALYPNTRKLVQVAWRSSTLKDIQDVMGSDVSVRKELLGLEG